MSATPHKRIESAFLGFGTTVIWLMPLLSWRLVVRGPFRNFAEALTVLSELWSQDMNVMVP
jgi:hypothetical protein